MSMVFLGKWTLGQGGNSVLIDLTSGSLSVAAPPLDGRDRFNAYGTAAAFVLQGANGLYVVSTGVAYAATAATGDAANQFTAEDAGSDQIRIRDLGIGGGATPSYWNDDSGALKAIAVTAAPPVTTAFTRTVVTVGLAEILQNGFGTPQPDLTWVNLSCVDFSAGQASQDFTNATLTHADLSRAVFSANTAFDDAVMTAVNLSGATLEDCSFGQNDLTGADLTDANMKGVDAPNCRFIDATLTGASFNGASNLAGASFTGAKAQRVDFGDVGNIVNTDFTGADLTGAIFTGASVTGKMTLNGCNMTDAALNNPGVVTIYPKMIVVDGATNFTRAKLQKIDFSGYALASMVFTGADMSGCNLQSANLTNAEMSYATLDGAMLTGTVRLNGANLSNASLLGVDMTGAQLGALSQLFSVDEAANPGFLTALQSGDGATVATTFSANGYPLSGAVQVTGSRFSTTTWTVSATLPAPATYTVIEEPGSGSGKVLAVYTPTTPAVLSNAFMVNVTLTGANLIGVNASGAAIYGINGGKPGLNTALLQEAQFNNANLSNADFSSAKLEGVNFDYATLSSAVFQNTQLTTAAGGARASFIGANMQGATFDGTTLNNVVLTNAAFGAPNPNDATKPAGVWLFGIPQADQAPIVAQLNNAAPSSTAPKPKHQFNLSLAALQHMQNPGPVDATISSQFSTAGITLTADAVLTIASEAPFWQLTDGQTQYVIFQSFDSDNYAPALGVATGTAYTTTPAFLLPLSLERDLNAGPVDDAVVAAFKAAGHSITAAATIGLAQHPTDWQIINGAPGYEVFSLWLWVDANLGGAAITVRPSLSNVISAFNDASIALSNRATVSLITTSGWMLNNDADDPYNPVKNYIVFNLIPNSTTGDLDVFGATMRILRMKSSTESEYFNIAVGITTMTQAQMNTAGTVCPNGEFAASNATNALPYDQWLRARMPPRPPFCVPDPKGLYVCPV